jgi:radical SAM protein with 4Fe4S-binding SPASM domain
MELKAGDKSWILSDDERPPLTAWLTINRACNLRCVWCYAKMTGYKKDTMTLETAGKSIALMQDLGLKSAILIGGEPTVHPNFFEIIRMVREAGMEAYLVTNAIRLADKHFFEKTLKAGVTSITVSFKAANSEMFIRDTGVDMFKTQVQAVRNIVESSINHVVNITACENLMANFDEMIEAVKSTGTDKFSIDTGKPIFLNGKSSVKGMGSPKEMADFFMNVYPKLEKSDLRFSVKVAVPFCLFPIDFVDKMIEDGNILTGCQMTSARGLIVDPLGRLLPCNHICDNFIGKIGEDFSTAEELRAFRRSEPMLEFYQAVSGYPDVLYSECEYWEMCGAGCKLYWLHYGADDMLGNFCGMKNKKKGVDTQLKQK